MAMPTAPKPPSLLGYHRLLSPLAGVRVSPLCLGTLGFGDAWKGRVGECNKETVFEILDTFYNAGGNFIDTANLYQDGQTEAWLGEWLEARQNRDEIVLATKYSMPARLHGPEKIKSNYQGNQVKSMRLAIDQSLKKLKTDYIDVYYVHMWDYTTSVEEMMQGLHHLVASGKVMYLGISAAPAWVVVKCNEYARFHGLTRFSVYQGHWSCAFRDMEREIIPMCESEGLAIAPWGVLGRGQFRSAEDYAREGRKMGPQDEAHMRMGATLDALAARKGTLATSIALAYVMHKAPYVFPVIGGRKVEHLKSNIEALAVELTREEVEEIEAAEKWDPGFPLNFLFEGPGQKYSLDMTARHMWQLSCNTRLETVGKPKPIEPMQGMKQFDM
ncbi:NADP-dependent oxidoreductase domain-containing protein [Staphylotrichum tortipilum]|uniref:NADP-dependent oxidoreductase domain-containing protein n=1 Tax=Staphylotrichum tortipilum TaxID=2831512 RepID=A0AAN6MQY0_9PEZI|nr:NADP-dependent oxidoreductase domain-containing protein [Staphylotrichum longicolle]